MSIDELKYEIRKLKDIIENLHSETFKQFDELKRSKKFSDEINTREIQNVSEKCVDVKEQTKENIIDFDNDDFSDTDSDGNDHFESETMYSSPAFERDSGFDDKSKLTDSSPDHSNMSTSPRRLLTT